MLKCDMCGKPLKEKRYQVVVPLRPELTLTVGPDCYRKNKKAVKWLAENRTTAEIAALRVKIAAQHSHQ